MSRSTLPVDRFADLIRVEHDLENPAVGISIKVFWGCNFDDFVDWIVLDQHGAEHHLFGFYALQRHFLKGNFSIDGHDNASPGYIADGMPAPTHAAHFFAEPGMDSETA